MQRLGYWRVLSRSWTNGGLVVGTIISPSWVAAKVFRRACYAFWQGREFFKNDEPQDNQVFCQMNAGIPELLKTTRACVKETGTSKRFSANITADDPFARVARWQVCLVAV